VLTYALDVKASGQVTSIAAKRNLTIVDHPCILLWIQSIKVLSINLDIVVQDVLEMVPTAQVRNDKPVYLKFFVKFSQS